MIDIAAAIIEYIPVIIVVLFISSIPLYVIVRYAGGETGIVKAISISLLLSFILAGATKFIGLSAGIFVLIAKLFIYQFAFKLSFIKALMVWAFQYLFVFLVTMLIISIII